MNRLENLNLKLHSLVIFRRLLNDSVLNKLSVLLSTAEKSTPQKLTDYTDFVSELFDESESLTNYVRSRVLSQENIYLCKFAYKEEISPVLEQCLTNELKTLEEISRLSAREIKEMIGYTEYLPEWTTSQLDLTQEYKNMLSNISNVGYGMFSAYHMFTVADGQIKPVKNPDPIHLSDLKGYARERGEVVDNTKALLNGKPAANVLLYGDAGTGKSSTVKAIVNEYKAQGLRLIEIRKNQLMEIPEVVESIYRNPLKFILFIDDLSFDGNNEEIGVLKALLEGTVSVKAPNAALYVTSNRRHIVSEKFSDRGDDIHTSETMQEQISLSERFGLSVNFSRPNKNNYLSIVKELVEQYGIYETDELELRAERFAMERGGRSPRAARQFVECLLSSKD